MSSFKKKKELKKPMKKTYNLESTHKKKLQEFQNFIANFKLNCTRTKNEKKMHYDEQLKKEQELFE